MRYIDKNDIDDIELLSLFQSGNQSAFEAIYDKYWHTMFTSAFFVLQDRQACMDVVQEIFVWLWARRDSVQIENLKAYLSAAVKFKTANYIRDTKTRTFFHTEYAHLARVQQEAGSVENDIELRELKSIIESAVNKLPPKCREIYSLSRNHGYSNKQISDKLNLSVKTVENQLTIALKRIKTSIKSFPFLLLMLLYFFLGK